MKFRVYILTSALTMTSVSTALANTQFEIETDPATFAMDGYALHFRVWPQSLPKMRLGAGIYSLSLPDAMINMNTKNKDEGWDVEINRGIGFFSEYYMSPDKQEWFVGIQLGHQSFTVKNRTLGNGTSEFSNILVMPYGGYRWQLNKRFYAQAWMGLGYTDTISGNAQINDETYDVSPVIPFGTLHVGYSF